MKSNFIKYVFIIFVITIIVAVIYKVKQNDKTVNEEPKVTVEEDVIKEINLGIAGFDTVNPIVSQNKYVQEISRIIYEPLFELDGEYKLKKCLASDWAKTSTTTYLIKIQKNIEWSDGEKFTVDDVIFTIDVLKQIPSIYGSNVQYVVNVNKVDEETLQITLDHEIPFFEYDLNFPIMSQKYFEGQDFSNTEKNNAPVGTGKYKITQNDNEKIILSKNDKYSREDLTLEKIEITKFAGVGELYNAFKLGKIDIVTTDNIGIENYIGTIGFNKQEVAGREFDYLALNTQSNILSYTEVRNAISHAINRENIIASFYNNKYKVTNYSLDYGSWLKGDETDNSYNPELAEQILEENGWEFKYNRWQKTENYKTQKIALNLLVKSSDVSKLSVAQNIKGQLENQGIRINIVQASDEQYNKAIESKNYDIALCSMYVSPSPNLETFFGEGNLANYSNEEVTDIMNQVKNTTDENILKEKYKRLIEIYKSDVPYLSLYNNKYTIAYSSELVGDLTPNWFYLFYGIEGWYK